MSERIQVTNPVERIQQAEAARAEFNAARDAAYAENAQRDAAAEAAAQQAQLEAAQNDLAKAWMGDESEHKQLSDKKMAKQLDSLKDYLGSRPAGPTDETETPSGNWLETHRDIDADLGITSKANKAYKKHLKELKKGSLHAVENAFFDAINAGRDLEAEDIMIIRDNKLAKEQALNPKKVDKHYIDMIDAMNGKQPTAEAVNEQIAEGNDEVIPAVAPEEPKFELPIDILSDEQVAARDAAEAAAAAAEAAEAEPKAPGLVEIIDTDEIDPEQQPEAPEADQPVAHEEAPVIEDEPQAETPETENSIPEMHVARTEGKPDSKEALTVEDEINGLYAIINTHNNKGMPKPKGDISKMNAEQKAAFNKQLDAYAAGKDDAGQWNEFIAKSLTDAWAKIDSNPEAQINTEHDAEQVARAVLDNIAKRMILLARQPEQPASSRQAQADLAFVKLFTDNAGNELALIASIGANEVYLQQGENGAIEPIVQQNFNSLNTRNSQGKYSIRIVPINEDSRILMGSKSMKAVMQGTDKDGRPAPNNPATKQKISNIFRAATPEDMIRAIQADTKSRAKGFAYGEGSLSRTDRALADEVVAFAFSSKARRAAAERGSDTPSTPEAPEKAARRERVGRAMNRVKENAKRGGRGWLDGAIASDPMALAARRSAEQEQQAESEPVLSESVVEPQAGESEPEEVKVSRRTRAAEALKARRASAAQRVSKLATAAQARFEARRAAEEQNDSVLPEEVEEPQPEVAPEVATAAPVLARPVPRRAAPVRTGQGTLQARLAATEAERQRLQQRN